MAARNDNFDGLHVLLVTEDDARAQAITKALRERKAHVGDVRAGSKDPVALRGADLLVIDARRGPSTDERVADVRSDVRARWASVATIDYTSLAGSDGTVDLRALESVVSKLAGMDKALTERARKENSFETLLAPLGPTRTLRALALAGPTLHVEFAEGKLKASVDLADELLVAAFADREGNRSEAWIALARVLGMTDATVVVERRAHPTAMNIMEPVDQALETAAQERVRTPELFAPEEPVLEELSGLHRERKSSRPASSEAKASEAKASETKASEAKAKVAPQPVATRGRTLVGVAPLPPPSNGGWPSSSRPGAPKRDQFAEVPTDPAAPGLLQRMAQAPANDGTTAEVKTGERKARPRPGDPELTYEHADVESENQEYDAGEVTVVADPSQLDILRETLGRLDAQGAPLTSTMPAPPGPPAPPAPAAALERERLEPIKSEPVLLTPKHREAPVEATSTQPAPTAPAAAAPAATAARPALRLNEATATARVKRAASPRKNQLWFVALLLLITLGGIAGLFWAKASLTRRTSTPAAEH